MPSKHVCVSSDERESVKCGKKYIEELENKRRRDEAARVFLSEVDRLPTVSFVYDGMHVKARVDSCAGRSIVGGQLAKKVTKSPAKNVAVVKGVCGTLIPIKHQARVTVEAVKAARLSFDALVMESCEE